MGAFKKMPGRAGSIWFFAELYLYPANYMTALWVEAGRGSCATKHAGHHRVQCKSSCNRCHDIATWVRLGWSVAPQGPSSPSCVLQSLSVSHKDYLMNRVHRTSSA